MIENNMNECRTLLSLQIGCFLLAEKSMIRKPAPRIRTIFQEGVLGRHVLFLQYEGLVPTCIFVLCESQRK